MTYRIEEHADRIEVVRSDGAAVWTSEIEPWGRAEVMGMAMMTQECFEDAARRDQIQAKMDAEAEIARSQYRLPIDPTASNRPMSLTAWMTLRGD